MQRIYFLLISLLMFFISSPTIEGDSQKPTLKNAVYLFNNLLNCPSEEAMQHTCESYHATPLGEENRLHGYGFSDGTDIWVRMDTTDKGRKIPFVEVHTNQDMKDFKNNLEKVYGFKKVGNDEYRRGNEFSRVQTVLTFVKRNVPQKTCFTCTKEYN